MVPYLVAEYPYMDRKESVSLKPQMMDGNKFATWVLELSFIGWYLLGLLCLLHRRDSLSILITRRPGRALS